MRAWIYCAGALVLAGMVPVRALGNGHGPVYGLATPTMGKGAWRSLDLAMYSIVVGYRPKPFRKGYPSPDWRVFVEVVGELNYMQIRN